MNSRWLALRFLMNELFEIYEPSHCARQIGRENMVCREALSVYFSQIVRLPRIQSRIACLKRVFSKAANKLYFCEKLYELIYFRMSYVSSTSIICFMCLMYIIIVITYCVSYNKKKNVKKPRDFSLNILSEILSWFPKRRLKGWRMMYMRR